MAAIAITVAVLELKVICRLQTFSNGMFRSHNISTDKRVSLHSLSAELLVLHVWADGLS